MTLSRLLAAFLSLSTGALAAAPAEERPATATAVAALPDTADLQSLSARLVPVEIHR